MVIPASQLCVGDVFSDGHQVHSLTRRGREVSGHFEDGRGFKIPIDFRLQITRKGEQGAPDAQDSLF